MTDQDSANRQAAWRGTAGLNEPAEQLELFPTSPVPHNTSSPIIRMAVALERIANAIDADAAAAVFLDEAMKSSAASITQEPVAQLRADWRTFSKVKKTGQVNLGTAGIHGGMLYIYINEGKVTAVEIENENDGTEYTLLPTK